MGLGFGPQIVSAFSMRKNELQVDGWTAPRSTASTAIEFFAEQYRLLQYMWNMPAQELSQEEAEKDQFALHTLSFEEAQNALGFEAGDTFWLTHPDLRVNNIIVDDELHIRGIIDWEFSVTVPPQAFLPPSWITGHDTGPLPPNISSEFADVLSSRAALSSAHSQLAQDWKFQDDRTLPTAYILLDPSNLSFLFYRRIYPRLFVETRDRVVARFFERSENKELQAAVVRRLRASEWYTQYLKDHDLFDNTEELEWQGLKQWTTETRAKLQELREWREKTQEELMRMEGQRPVQGGDSEGPSVPCTT